MIKHTKKKRHILLFNSLLRWGEVVFFMGIDHFAFCYCSDCYVLMIGRSQEYTNTL